MNFTLKLFLTMILGFWCAHVAASDADALIPCEGCPDFATAPHPDGGIWYNPTQSGTGFVLTLQGNRLAGYYYLYSEDGAPEWLLFTSDLKPAEEPYTHWVLEADLERIVDGACLNCEYKEAVADQVVGQIRFEFSHANRGQFQIDNGEPQPIRTLPFGWDIATVFAGQPDYPVPDLEGYWSISVMDEVGMMYSRGYELVDFSHDADGELNIMLAGLGRNVSLPAPAPFERAGDLYCGSFEDIAEIAGPLCEIILEDFPDERFLLPLGNLGSSRIQAESGSGLILHAYRIHLAK